LFGEREAFTNQATRAYIVAVGDILAEVETDKATMEMEAFDEGTSSGMVSRGSAPQS
jgi:anti-sigma regulatory factor (Ser/Thr protein kinase)